MKVAVLNGFKVNYDHSIDYHILADDVTVYDDTTKDNFLKHVGDSEIIVAKEMVVDKEMIESLPESVKLIVEAGTGYNNIDIEAAKKKHILVCNTPAYSTKRVAHTAIMLMLNLASSMKKQIRMIAKGDKSNFEDHLSVDHMEINDKILGVVGAGHIGLEVIKIAKALGMKIYVYTRTPKDNLTDVTYVSLEQLLKESDYVSLHCPLTKDTYHLIHKDNLKLMKPTSFIINTSRGALIDEEALIEALKNKQIAGAGLDVHEVEPPIHTELYGFDNVINTPHMGWRGKETRARLIKLVKEDIDAYINHQPINVVNE